MLKACLNGGVSPFASIAAVPITAAELAADAVKVRAAGADAVHVHPRDGDGRESLDAAAVGAAVAAIRRACPGLPVGVSTGAWMEPDPARRVEAIAAWSRRNLPDFASVNAHEDGAARRGAARCSARGIGVEAGIWTPAAVDAYRAWRHADPPHPRRDDGGRPGRGAERTPTRSSASSARPRRRSSCTPKAPRCGRSCVDAIRHNKDIRVGLEDTRTLPDGAPAPDNATLVAAAVSIRENETREAGQEGL